MPFQLKPGQFIRFSYAHQDVDAHTGPKHKEILVLNPKWQNKVHGVDLARLTPTQREILEFILDPKNDNTSSRFPRVNEIRRTMDPIEDIGNPNIFYSRFIKPFLGKSDAYRMYVEKLMSNRVLVKDAPSRRKAPTREPLFGERPSPVAKAEPAAGPKPLTPIDIMAQNAKDKGLK